MQAAPSPPRGRSACRGGSGDGATSYSFRRGNAERRSSNDHASPVPSRLAPWLAPFATDARFFRRHGTVAYGFTLHDRSMDLAKWLSLFHGDDERVSLDALANAVSVYDEIARRFLG